jgi:hypothetical protein
MLTRIGVGFQLWRISQVDLEMRNSERLEIEMPVTFEVGKKTFSGTAANLSDDGMLIESSLARKNIEKVLKNLLKTPECPVQVRYAAEGRSFARRGIIKHYHLDFPGGDSAYRLSLGIWIPKLRMRQDKGL